MIRRNFLSTYLFVFINLVISGCQSGSNTPVNESTVLSERVDLTLEQFKAKMNAPDVLILDVRTPQETAQGVIPNAMTIDFHSPDFTTQINALATDKTYLVYCKSGGRSSAACQMMKKSGLKAYNLLGGYTAWKRQ